MKQSDRFICAVKQGGPVGAEVWIDTITGVNYLYIREGFSGGLCPLLNADGTPMISPEYRNEK